MSDPEAYHPLNVLKPVAPDIWIVDARLPSNSFSMPIRMTVLRVGRDLILHSPTPYNQALKDALEELGAIRHLVAPSVAHWMYLKEWQDQIGGAKTWAVAGLGARSQVRQAGLRIDEELDGRSNPFGPDIDTVYIGGPVFRELDLFHRPSRTLVLTDLVLNLEPERMSLPARLVCSLLGVLAPEGRAAIYVRLLLKMNREEAGAAAQRLVEFAPERVVFAHGKWFDDHASYQLRRSLRWLLPVGNGAQAETSYRQAAIPIVAVAGAIVVAALLWRLRCRRRA